MNTSKYRGFIINRKKENNPISYFIHYSSKRFGNTVLHAWIVFSPVPLISTIFQNPVWGKHVRGINIVSR